MGHPVEPLGKLGVHQEAFLKLSIRSDCRRTAASSDAFCTPSARSIPRLDSSWNSALNLVARHLSLLVSDGKQQGMVGGYGFSVHSPSFGSLRFLPILILARRVAPERLRVSDESAMRT